MMDIHIVQAPPNYSPSFCDMARVSMAQDVCDIKDSVGRGERRFYGLLVLGVVQLLSVVGALGDFRLTKVELSKAAVQVIMN